MALVTPTTQQISTNLIAQISGSIQRDIPLLPKSFSRVLAKALAGVYVMLYKYAGFVLLQQFVRYASFVETEVNGKLITPLIEWGRAIGVGDPIAATAAQLSVQFAVTNPDSSTLEAGKQLVHPSSGVIYLTLDAVTLTGSPLVVDVVAASDPNDTGGAGVIGNRLDGDVLKWANPIPQLSTDGATVLATVSQGAEAETEAVYRQRVVDRFAARPQGGAYADYTVWGGEVEGIINIYPYTGAPGEVDVYAEATEASSGNADGTPTPAQRQAVEDAINLDQGGLASRRQVGAKVTVYGITRASFDVEVIGLTPDNGTARDAIEASLIDLLNSREPFITGISRFPRRDRVTVAGVSGTVDDTASAVGATVVSAMLKQGGGTLTEYTLGQGEKAKLGNVTYL